MLTLECWCRQYVRHNPLTRKAAYQLERSCRLFVEYAGRMSAKTITADVLSDWLATLELGYSPRYVRNHRANVLTILRFAADRAGYPEIPARHVRRIKIPPPAPWAWSDEELARLVVAASCLIGQVKHRPRVSRSHYMLALVGSAYDTGLRRGDLFALDHEHIDQDGMIRLRQHKTSEPHLCRLSRHVADLVRTIPYERPLRWTGSNGGYTLLWKELTIAAGIRHGALQQIRRTAATSVWERDPALVQQFLGHRSEGMWKFYVDRYRKARPVTPSPIV